MRDYSFWVEIVDSMAKGGPSSSSRRGWPKEQMLDENFLRCKGSEMIRDSQGVNGMKESGPSESSTTGAGLVTNTNRN